LHLDTFTNSQQSLEWTSDYTRSCLSDEFVLLFPPLIYARLRLALAVRGFAFQRHEASTELPNEQIDRPPYHVNSPASGPQSLYDGLLRCIGALCEASNAHSLISLSITPRGPFHGR
jgi:hypothetical protein